MKQWLFHIRQDWLQIPQMIRWMSLMLFLFVFGRGLGGDVYFSIYIKTIVNNTLWVSLLGSLLAFFKMILSLTIGNLDDKANFARVLQSGKRIYVFCGLCFALAGFLQEPFLLVVAVALNGVGSAIVFTTYQYYFGSHSDKTNRYAVLGLMNSAIFIAYVLGSLLAAVLVQYLPLRSMYLFVSIFSLVSMWGWKQLEDEVTHEAKALTDRFGVWRQMLLDLFSKEPYHHSMRLFRDYGLGLASRLGLVALTRAVDYVGLLFIPVLAIANDFSLSQIAILFAVMRIPPMLSYVIGDLEDRLPYQGVLSISLGGLALAFVGLSLTHNFFVLIGLGIVMGLFLTMLRPLVTGDVLARVKSHDMGSTSGVINVAARLGEIVGSLLFGVIVSLASMQVAFGSFAALIGCFFFYFLLTFYKK